MINIWKSWKFDYSINSFRPVDACMCHWTGPSLLQVMDCFLFGAKPLPEPVFIYCQLDDPTES